MMGHGLIEKVVAPTDYLVDIPDFYKKMNDFDVQKVQAAAKSCRMG